MAALPVPVPRPGELPAPAITDELTRAATYAEASKAELTRLAYGRDWRDFTAWCTARGAQPLPASIETIAAYLASLADRGRKASTISRRKAAIAYAHRLAGHEPLTQAEPVKAVLSGIRRRIGVAVTRKAPATARAIGAMLKRLPDTLTGKRDRALLLIGFSAALRRSELAALEVGDIEWVEHGIFVHIRSSKTDQESAGHQVAIPRGSKLKPVEALEAWIAALTLSLKCTEVTTGPLFRPIAKGNRVLDRHLSGQAIADIVKHHAGAAKLDPALFSGHSLRAGFVTTALERGADPFKVMDVTRHRSVDTLRVYDRRAKAFKDHAGKDFL